MERIFSAPISSRAGQRTFRVLAVPESSRATDYRNLRSHNRSPGMAKYFIDLRDSHGTVRDDEGAEYPQLEDALSEAKASARDMVEQYMDGRVSLNATCVEVRDEDGCTVATLTVAEVLEHPLHPAFKQRCADTPMRGHH